MEEEAHQILNDVCGPFDRPETLADIALELFGAESGVELDIPPRQTFREPPDHRMILLLDTNVVSELMRPQPEARVLTWIGAQALGVMSLFAITVMEIRYGIACLPEGVRKDGLEAKFRQFLARGFAGRVLPFDEDAANKSAAIRARRPRIGHAIGAEGCMIAGIALHQGAIVVTRDAYGFAGCGISVVNPWHEPA
jgi:predicted nucleic acid-binding protein